MRRHCESRGRQTATKYCNLVIDQKFLRDALGNIGHAAVIPDQKLDLLSSQLNLPC